MISKNIKKRIVCISSTIIGFMLLFTNYAQDQETQNQLKQTTCTTAACIVKYIDSIGIDKLKGWSAKPQTQDMQVHYMDTESDDIVSSYVYYFTPAYKQLRVTSGTFDSFLERIGYKLSIQKEYMFLILELKEKVVYVSGKKTDGTMELLQQFPAAKISSKFTKLNIFQKAQELQEITSAVGCSWHYNSVYKFWRFLTPEGQLIFYPLKDDITAEGIEGCINLKPQWYLYKS